jgi:hypothetical protein
VIPPIIPGLRTIDQEKYPQKSGTFDVSLSVDWLAVLTFAAAEPRPHTLHPLSLAFACQEHTGGVLTTEPRIRSSRRLTDASDNRATPDCCDIKARRRSFRGLKLVRAAAGDSGSSLRIPRMPSRRSDNPDAEMTKRTRERGYFDKAVVTLEFGKIISYADGIQ